jgi:hypothetical protein
MGRVVIQIAWERKIRQNRTFFLASAYIELETSIIRLYGVCRANND